MNVHERSLKLAPPPSVGVLGVGVLGVGVLGVGLRTCYTFVIHLLYNYYTFVKNELNIKLIVLNFLLPNEEK